MGNGTLLAPAPGTEGVPPMKSGEIAEFLCKCPVDLVNKIPFGCFFSDPAMAINHHSSRKLIFSLSSVFTDFNPLNFQDLN